MTKSRARRIPLPNELVEIETQLQPLLPRFQDVLRGVSPLTAQALVRSILISCELTPRIVEADRQSLFNAAMTAACLGLPCDGVTGQACLVPFNNRQKRKLMVQLIIGYRGYNTLGARSGLTITGAVVREHDHFEYDLGSNGVSHQPDFRHSNAPIYAAWAKAAHATRPPVLVVLSLADILAIKDRSPNGQEPPWADPKIGFPAMAEKSAKRRLSRSLPLNVMQTAAQLDQAYEEMHRAAWITPERGLMIEAADVAPQPAAASLTLDRDPPRVSREITLAERLVDYRKKLDTSHAKGKLAECWGAIEREYQIELWKSLPAEYQATLKLRGKK
jgi:phage RecT family recombinase